MAASRQFLRVALKSKYFQTENILHKLLQKAVIYALWVLACNNLCLYQNPLQQFLKTKGPLYSILCAEAQQLDILSIAESVNPFK